MIEQQYIDLFNDNRSKIDKNSVKGMNRHRDAAFEAFSKSGFPTSKLEDYKNTNIARLFDANFGININNLPIEINPYDAFKCDVPNLNTHLYFMINDRFYNNGSESLALPKGVFVGSMQNFAEKHSKIFKKHYAQAAKVEENGTIAFNTMFAQDGFVVYVPENVVIEQPLQLINLLKSGVDTSVNRRTLIIAEKNAQVKLLVCDHAMDDVEFVVTQVTEIFADRDAQVDVYELEENSAKTKKINNLYSEQKENSHVNVSGITLHNGVTRNNYTFRLLGEYAEAHIGGLAICDKEQHVDNFAFLDHSVPNCHSNELFKYALQDKSTGVFCGKILVEVDAQKTLAYQDNKNLLISEDARMYSKPQLEIYADDVKCSHGLTTGHIDDDALFYLQARGISEAEARMILMVAFTIDVVDMIRIESLRERLEDLIDKRFRGKLMRCGDCEVCK